MQRAARDKAPADSSYFADEPNIRYLESKLAKRCLFTEKLVRALVPVQVLVGTYEQRP